MTSWNEQFHTIAELLQCLASARTSQEQVAKIQKFFNEFKQHRSIAHTGNEAPTIYPVLRLLVPELDRERKSYGLREKTLGEGYVRALALDRNSDEATRLLSHRSVGADLADQLVPLLRGRCPARGELSVAEVNRRLDALANQPAKVVEAELSFLIEHCSPLEHRWLVRIVLRKLRLGYLSARRILQLYHPDAPALLDSTGELRHVVQQLENTPDGEDLALQTPTVGSSIRLFHFIKPMLCQRLELPQVGALLTRHTFWLETKMDGERFQIHKDGPRYRYLSRNGVDYSETFGSTADQLDGTLTPMLAQLLKESVTSVILDGEMMVFDRRTLRYRDKCDGGADVKALRPGNGELRACFCVYDVLLLNGTPLTDLPYGERAALLGTVFVREQIGFLVRCKRELVRDAPHLVQLLNEAIDGQQEGVVLKREDAPYRPNRRAGGGWYKIKPDYIAGLVTDFDLVVLGGYYNAYRSAVNVLVVGAVDDAGHYLPVVKVSMGLSDAQWTELNRSLRPHWREVKREEATGPVRWGRSGPPDVCIDPAASIVLQLKGSELVRSGSYAAGYTIRFPRIVAIRSDKLPDEVCQVAELKRLANEEHDPRSVTEGDASRKAFKLANGHVTLEHFAPVSNPGSSKPGPSGGRRRKLTVATTTGKDTTVEGGILARRDICVMGGFPGCAPIRELEALVRRHGGRAVANPSDNTFAIVVTGGSEKSFKVRKFIETGRYDMVRADWLQRATANDAGHLEPFRPSDMLSHTEATRLALAEAYDRYGDSYTRTVSPTSFRALLKHDAGGIWHGVHLSERELLLAERTLVGPDTARRRRLFRGQSARLYLPPKGEGALVAVGNLRAQREMLRFVGQGGRWLRDTDSGPVTYVFCQAGTEIDEGTVRSWLKNVAGAGDVQEPDEVTVLTVEWIEKSLEREQLCDVKEFLLSNLPN
ncbi:AGAP000623-PA-like protein [Anopheles sinensis]|uniref:DNA ligase 4 n=1 Tax=Anopheles sinensis TaxID=74873 RepID=A0A084WF34_ANOSI|nr:AGAP000623-PA-like protein [Anopheles sinensis]